MPVYVSLLRAVNVGGHGKLEMKALRELFQSLGYSDAVTLLQTGNIVFTADARDELSLASRIEDAIVREFDIRPIVILRTPEELRKVVSANPFKNEAKSEPSKLLVTFLQRDPGKEAQKNVAAIRDYPEQLHLKGRELFAFYPNGAGRPKLPASMVDRALLKTPGTARNWNTVLKLLALTEQLA